MLMLAYIITVLLNIVYTVMYNINEGYSGKLLAGIWIVWIIGVFCYSIADNMARNKNFNTEKSSDSYFLAKWIGNLFWLIAFVLFIIAVSTKTIPETTPVSLLQ